MPDITSITGSYIFDCC